GRDDVRHRANGSVYRSRKRAVQVARLYSVRARSSACSERLSGDSSVAARLAATCSTAPTDATAAAELASSGMTPTRVPATGRPHAAASMATIPWASWRDVSTKQLPG